MKSKFKYDGKSRPVNKAYEESWNRIFGKKESIKTLKLLHAVDKMVGYKTLANYPVNLKRELGPSQKVTI